MSEHTSSVRSFGRKLRSAFARKPVDGQATSDNSGLFGASSTSMEHGSPALDHLATPVYTTDADGRITYFNEAAAELWGRRPNLGGDWWCGSWRLYWPDGTLLPPDECPMAVALKSGDGARGVEIVAERPDGARVPLLAYPTPIRDEAGTMTGAVNMLVDISGRKQAEDDLQASENRYRGLFQNVGISVWEEDFSGVVAACEKLRTEGVTDLREYFRNQPDRLTEMIGRVRVTDVNDYTVALFEASDKAELLGGLDAILLPETRKNFLEEFVAVWEGRRSSAGETAIQTLKGKRLDVIFNVAFEGEHHDRTLVSLVDITARKHAEKARKIQRRRFKTLNEVARTVSSNLALDQVVQSVTDVATKISGAKFGAFFYNVIRDDGEALLLYALSGAPIEAFEKFGLPRNTEIFDPTFRGEGVVRSNDIRKDPRYGKNAPHHGMPKGHLPVVSYLAVPVVSRSGEVIGGLFFGHPKPGIFTRETEELVKGVATHAAGAIDNARLHEAAQGEIERRKDAEKTGELLLKELRHRVGNTLAIVQAIARQTLHGASGDEKDAFTARLQTLGRAHDLLTDHNWKTARVEELVWRALDPFCLDDEERISMFGAELSLDARQSLMLAMVLHELATNAVKHGALSNDTGTVSVTWEHLDDKKNPRLKINWREDGGPSVAPPQRTGFGSKLLESSAVAGSASFEYAPEGLRCSIELAIG